MHRAGVLNRLLNRLRTKLGGSGQATATALPRALSPSGPGFGAQEERKPFVLHNLEPLRPAELVLRRAPFVPLFKPRSQVQVRTTRTAPPELLSYDGVLGPTMQGVPHRVKGCVHALHGGEEEVLVVSGPGGEEVHFGLGVGRRLFLSFTRFKACGLPRAERFGVRDVYGGRDVGRV